MDLSQLSIYLIATLVFIWLILYVFSTSKRAKQWLLLSSLFSIGLAPIAALLTNDISFTHTTMLSAPWNSLEIGAIFGLLWGVCATLPYFRKSGSITLPIRTTLWRTLALYAGLLLAIILAQAFNISAQLALIAIVGITILVFGANNLRLLLLSSGIGVAIAGLALLIGAVVPLVFSVDGYTSIAGITDSILSYTDIVLIGVYAVAAIIITPWVLHQPIKTS